ncbi:unnamed protein product [Polarella glacialis]|uniref:Uncharacterized protein n=1 Tax=Polarella glacialis TaxID=89957 RepID=A0A813HGP0_POLGL|nr:unnamed protein product [Polarella glacialis]
MSTPFGRRPSQEQQQGPWRSSLSGLAPWSYLSTSLEDVQEIASYGNLPAAALDQVFEGAQILEALNAVLKQRLHWYVYLWRSRRHWAVVLRPDLDHEDPTLLARVDTDLLRKTSSLRASAASPEEPGDETEQNEVMVQIPARRLFLTFELLLSSGASQDFFPRLRVYPDFDISNDNVEMCGFSGPQALSELSALAQQVVCRYRMYGLLGCNCQHFASDFLTELRTGAADGSPLPDDVRLSQAAETGVRAISIVNGLAKGISGAKAAFALSSSVIIGGAPACAGTAVAACGLAVLTGHVLLGCAVGAVGSASIRRSYEWLHSRHRRQADDPPIAGPAGEQQTADTST